MGGDTMELQDASVKFCSQYCKLISDEQRDYEKTGLCRIAYDLFHKNDQQRLSPSTTLYHILPLEYFLQTFAKGVLRFTCIDAWRHYNDAREGFVFSQSDPMCDLKNFLKSSYGMSWTDSDESKAMWCRYGVDNGNGIGVRVGVMTQHIACALCAFWRENGLDVDSDDAKKCRLDKVSIRPVEYLKECDLTNMLNRLNTEQGQQEIAAQDRDYFHKKSNLWQEEREIRVYTQVLDGQLKDNRTLFSPHKFLEVKFDKRHINSISVCPRAHEGEIARAMLRLHEHGFGTDLVRVGHVE